MHIYIYIYMIREEYIRREDLWIIKLETLAPKGLNQGLNNV